MTMKINDCFIEAQLNFLFWNTNKKYLKNEIAILVKATAANIIVLAENIVPSVDIIKELHSNKLNFFETQQIACKRIHIFTDFSPSHFNHFNETDKYTIKELILPGKEPLLLGMVHLPSKLHKTEDDQLADASLLRVDIEDSEKKVQHQNTIIFGDFNMNPFEKGMVSAHAMHSIPCLKTAKIKSRTINKNKYDFFYNPCWNLLGDFTEPPGSHFYSTSSYISLYWNLLDQVIARPDIADKIDSKSLKVISKIGGLTLVNKKGKPNRSDHLPLFFSLK